jgi:hypothetical protein
MKTHNYKCISKNRRISNSASQGARNARRRGQSDFIFTVIRPSSTKMPSPPAIKTHPNTPPAATEVPSAPAVRTVPLTGISASDTTDTNIISRDGSTVADSYGNFTVGSLGPLRVLVSSPSSGKSTPQPSLSSNDPMAMQMVVYSPGSFVRNITLFQIADGMKAKVGKLICPSIMQNLAREAHRPDQVLYTNSSSLFICVHLLTLLTSWVARLLLLDISLLTQNQSRQAPLPKLPPLFMLLQNFRHVKLW